MTDRHPQLRPTRSQSGQVLIITAVALVVLLVVAALVVDIGLSVMLRRQEQNATDPGSLAAARFIADDQTIDVAKATQAACYYARMNGFFTAATDNSGCVPANDPNAATLTVNYPPDVTAGQYAGHLGFVQVKISRDQGTFFGRVIGQDTITVTTGAVAARQRGETNTHSLIALYPGDCGPATLANPGSVHGTATIHIDPVPGYTGPGGYVQVNSECGASRNGNDLCSPGQGGLVIAGTAHLYAPKVNVYGSCQGPEDEPHGVLDEAAVQIGDPLAGLVGPYFDYTLDGQSCGTDGGALKPTGQYAQGCSSSGTGRRWTPSIDPERTALCPGLPANYDCIHLYPGVYYGGWNIDRRMRVVLEPGIYILAGGGINIGNNGTLDSVVAPGADPAPVLLYNTDNPNYSCPRGAAYQCQDDMDLTAGANLKLAGLLGNVPCPPVTNTGGCPYGGMVIWYDGDGSQGYDGLVKIAGGVELIISGTIYAPKAHVELTGNSATNTTGNECPPNPTQKASVQIISWTWDIGGTGDLCMPYNPALLYKLNQQGLVH
jgi:Flp pilus assembly protein TadG